MWHRPHSRLNKLHEILPDLKFAQKHFCRKAMRLKQKTMEELCFRIIGLAGNQKKKNIVVAFGSGGFNHASKGHGSAPVKGLKRALNRHVRVMDADEFRTSRQCSNCGHELKCCKENGTRLDWGLRRCNNNECQSTWWNRDFNAARNIGWMFLLRQHRLRLPLPFRRKRGTDELDELDSDP